MSKSFGLGRGLGAILEEVEEAYKQNSGSGEFVKEIDPKEIIPNPFQPRKSFDEASIAELGQSIAKHGLLQPIIVVRSGEKFMLIAGERRLRAVKMAKIDKIKAIVVDVDKNRMREFALIENIQRENLNSVDLALSLQELIEEHRLTHDDLAEIVKKSRSYITNMLRLLQLTDYVKEKLAQNKISYGHARALIGLDEANQKSFADSIVGQKLSVREVEDMVINLKTGSKKQKSPPLNPQIRKKRLNLERLNSQLLEIEGLKTKKTETSITIFFEDQAQIDKLSASFES